MRTATFFSGCCLCAILALTACGSSQRSIPPGPPPGTEEARSDAPRILPDLTTEERSAFARDSAAFAFGLHGELLKDPGARAGNAVWSPPSVQFAFAMAYAGAEGNTAAEMARALHFSLPRDRQLLALNALDLELSGRAAEALQAARDRAAQTGSAVDPADFRLRLVNSVWGDRGFRFERAYLDSLARNFGAGVRLADFRNQPDLSRRSINAWVKDETQGRIQDLLQAGTIDTYTRAVLVNALHLKLPWAEPFPISGTVPAPFTRRDGSIVDVPFMNSALNADYAEAGLFRMVAVPLAGQAIVFAVITPRPELMMPADPALTAEAAAGLVQALHSERLLLALPRFGFTSPALSLKPLMQRLGMVEAFTPEAHFEGISAEKPLFISDALHKAMAAVDEKGVEAAAATAVLMGTTSAPTRSVKIDRPFTFGIYDRRTATWLFLGQVTDPSR